MKKKDLNEKRFEYLNHPADMKIRAFGSSLEEVFSNVALGMINHLSSVDKINNSVFKKIHITGKRLESLLYDFLEEILIFIDTDGILIGKIIKIKITKNDSNYELIATVAGDYYKNYEVRGDIKAVTYNDMYIKNEDDKWEIQVVFDI